ncbi:hypothetical protein [uncultured Roseobacter sp.]|uniref:hypothetical protein n=1 Tax=uncultured Roseobacter sp. TaxID=114847 RepID=UPI0026298DCA|nr:hypothetical protein [uncultured Roseobacter sp.]
MPRPKKDTVFGPLKPAAETTLDKTTRIVREITEGEAEKRQIKTARLRAARLEREANTAVDAPAEQPKRRGRTPKATQVKR